MKMGKLLSLHAISLPDPRNEDASTHATSTQSQNTSQSVSSAHQKFLRKQTLCLGNPFKEATLNLERTMVKDGHIKAGHDKAFKPAKIV